jgi:hypothetical protein
MMPALWSLMLWSRCPLAQAVIQLAKAKGLKTVNVIRDRWGRGAGIQIDVDVVSTTTDSICHADMARTLQE